MDPEECEAHLFVAHLFENVRTFYTGLNLNLDEDIPISLVDRDEMSRVHKRNYEMRWDIIGLATCRDDVQNTKTELKRRKKPTNKPGGKFRNTFRTANKQTNQRRKHNKLLFLFERPDYSVLMGMTLAHEMMHAWLRLEGNRKDW
ncbi:hypothetical protein L3X38_044736 [Prunus dulcis]|uniref:Protein DA1-like domain-containing protein n=1 Tax=Prunus dulcis TaxID=3755 RepID=A0AAD4UZ76_PRUDU|nr:hypothetical protein L3X38_044736 [Prunus dulcis]